MEDELKSSLLSSEHGKGREKLTSVRNLVLLGSFNLTNGVLAGLAMLAKIQQYVPRYHMSLIWGSCVDFLMTIAGVYASIFIGWFGDKIKMRWGKRKPLLLITYPLKLLAMLLLMFPPESQMGNPVFVRVWYMSCMCSWWALYTIFSSVFSAWFIELLLPSEYQDYSVFASAVPSLLGFLIGSGLSFVNALDQIGLGLAVCALALLIAVVYVIPSREAAEASSPLQHQQLLLHQQKQQHPPLLSSLRVLTRTAEYKIVLLNRIAFSTAYFIGREFLLTGVFTLFPGIEHFQRYKAVLLPVSIAANLVSVGGQVLLSRLLRSRKIDKIDLYRRLTLAVAVLSLLQCIFFLPVLFPGGSTPAVSEVAFIAWLAYTAGLLGALFMACMTLESLIFRDVVRFDTFTTNLNRENMYQTAVEVPAQLATAFFKAIPLTLLTLTGLRTIKGASDDRFSAMFQWNVGTQVQVATYTVAVFSLGAVISWWLFRDYALTQDVADKIEAALSRREERRREGDGDAKTQGEGGGEKGGGGGEEWEGLVVSGTGEGFVINNADEDHEDHEGHEGHEADKGRPSLDRSDVRLIEQLDSGKSNIAERKREMLMLHFSDAEVCALSSSSSSSGGPRALQSIVNFHCLGLYVFSPLAVTTLGFALVRVLDPSDQNTEFSVFISVLFCLSTVLWLYEFLRSQPMAALSRLAPSELRVISATAKRKNALVHESLAELLARNGIDADERLGSVASVRGASVGAFRSSDVSALGSWPYLQTFFFQMALAAVALVVALVDI